MVGNDEKQRGSEYLCWLSFKCKEQQKQQQKLCGNAYNTDYLEYVLRDKMGNRIKPGYVSQHFRIVLTKNNLKLIRFHDLRHPYVKSTTKNIILESRKPKLQKYI